MKSFVPHLPRIIAASVLLGAGLVLRAAPGGADPLPATLDLPTAIRYAVENNYTIREARERIREQEGVEITVKARQIPNVSASGTYTGNARAVSLYGPPDNDRAWAWSLASSM